MKIFDMPLRRADPMVRRNGWGRPRCAIRIGKHHAEQRAPEIWFLTPFLPPISPPDTISPPSGLVLTPLPPTCPEMWKLRGNTLGAPWRAGTVVGAHDPSPGGYGPQGEGCPYGMCGRADSGQGRSMSAQRNPTSKSLSPGFRLLRSETRMSRGRPIQDPPRRSRSVPLVGPPGS